MRAGELSYPKARTLIDATATLDRAQCAQVEAKVPGGRDEHR